MAPLSLTCVRDVRCNRQNFDSSVQLASLEQQRRETELRERQAGIWLAKRCDVSSINASFDTALEIS